MTNEIKNITSTFIESDFTDGVERKWYNVDGHCYRTGVDFENEEFAICQDGEIIDGDGCPLTPGDRQTVALKNILLQSPHGVPRFDSGGGHMKNNKCKFCGKQSIDSVEHDGEIIYFCYYCSLMAVVKYFLNEKGTK